MLESILGSVNSERVLVFLVARKEGYAREIAGCFKTGLSPIQKQLERLESSGVIFSKMVGRTRVYAFDPRYPFLNELQALIEKALSFYPESMREQLLMNRRRPRRSGKPL
ncbi:MAG: winged helix-turn-helix transcriptional regulator [Deltaproteobacteria bacterium]|nr:winged helix-turn-helix transcriptional regulator [Deltaproteobacteria bacterium]